jgi:hypothetical protein
MWGAGSHMYSWHMYSWHMYGWHMYSWHMYGWHMYGWHMYSWHMYSWQTQKCAAQLLYMQRQLPSRCTTQMMWSCMRDRRNTPPKPHPYA